MWPVTVDLPGTGKVIMESSSCMKLYSVDVAGRFQADDIPESSDPAQAEHLLISSLPLGVLVFQITPISIFY